MKNELRKWFAESIRMAKSDVHPQGWSVAHLLAWALRCAESEMPGPSRPLPR